MIAEPEIELNYALTDGNIAANNLESARQQSWSRFWQDPLRPRIAEHIVEQEQLATQFLGGLGALDRLERLVNHLDRADGDSPRTALMHAKVASMGHRFADARKHLAQAAVHGAEPEEVNRLMLSIDQACGTGIESVLEARQRTAAQSGRLEELVPLGALLADMQRFNEADQIYRRALREYHEVSPFAVAWTCFQLGVLWGELVADPQSSRAAGWYEKAIEYLPCYVKARVHLAEIYFNECRLDDAEALLRPALPSGDPEVNWRLADVLAAMGRLADSAEQLHFARTGFETLLEKHLLAFADHGAEFYSGSGNDASRALELANINVANRPTLRAVELARKTAFGVDCLLR